MRYDTLFSHSSLGGATIFAKLRSKIAPAVGAKMCFFCHASSPERRAFEGCIDRTRIALPFIGRFRRGLDRFFSEGIAL